MLDRPKPQKGDKDLRIQIGRVLHKAIRQFGLEGCPEAFAMTVHIDQFISKSREYYEPIIQELEARLEQVRVDSYAQGCAVTTEIFKDAVEQAKEQVRAEVVKEVEYLIDDYFNLSFGEFAGKYDVSKGKLPGDEIRKVLQALKGGTKEVEK